MPDKNKPLELFPYQKEGVDILCHCKDVLLADHPGAGKTAQVVVALELLGCKNILVVCPASLRENWKREFLKWGVKPRRITCIYKTPGNYEISPLGVVIISYDLAGKIPVSYFGHYDALVLDEAHFLKNPNTSRTRKCLGALWDKAERHIAITGTPLPNGRAIEAFPLFNKMDPVNFGKKHEFLKKYCVPEILRFHGKRVTRYHKSKNLDQLGRIARANFMLRRDRAETVGQLPPLVRMQVPVAVLNSPSCDFSDKDVERIVAGDHSPEVSTIRRLLGVSKVDASVQYIKDLLSAESQIVVFFHHAEVGLALHRNHFESCGAIFGSTSMTARQALIDEFQKGGIRVLLCSLLACNTGITLTAASTIVFVECDWVPSNNEQAEGRCYRVGQKDVTKVHYLVVPDSLDDKVTAAVLKKQRDITEVMGET